MPRELQPLFDAIGDFFGSPIVQLFFQGVALFFIVLWFASAYWAFRDMQQRTDNPVMPYLAAAFIIVFTPAFFLVALLVYRIVRPHEKVGEVYERNLAEAAMLAEIEAIPHCPTCDRRVHEEWIICPGCRTRLKRVCPSCNRLVGTDWTICAWCGRDFERREALATIQAIPSKRPASDEPVVTEIPALPGPADAPPSSRAAGDEARASARERSGNASPRARMSSPAPDPLADG
jgi:hypothetical protein